MYKIKSILTVLKKNYNAYKDYILMYNEHRNAMKEAESYFELGIIYVDMNRPGFPGNVLNQHSTILGN